MQITDKTKTKVHNAITKAEKKTSSEIVAVVSQHSGKNTYLALMVSLLLALIISLGVAHYSIWFNAVEIVLFQAIITLLLFAFVSLKAVLYTVMPKSLLHKNARLKSYETFEVLNLKTIVSHQACMLFVSLYEHHVQIVVDDEIAKKVDNAIWQEIVDNFTVKLKEDKVEEGFVEAIEHIGKTLAYYFPDVDSKKDNFSNELIELSKK